MRIALIIHQLQIEGGGERQIICLAHALKERGHEVIIYTSAYDQANCYPQLCHALTIHDVGRGLWPSLRHPFFLRSFLDMLHLARGVDGRYEIWNPHHWPAQWAAGWLKKKSGGKVVWMANDVPDFALKVFHPGSMRDALLIPLRLCYFFFDRIQNRRVDLAVLLSNWATHQFKLHYPLKTTIVPSGMDPTRFTPGGDRRKIRDRFGCTDGEFLLLWLGIFMPHRRLENAIRAVHELASRGVRVRLLLAGSDRSFPQYVNELKELTKNLGVSEQVNFAGKISDEEIRDFYASCDGFVFPNEGQTWGLVVLEAMACGCLVFVSRGAAVHEALADGETAILFSAGNPRSLAQKIEMAIGSPQLREQIAARGMQMVRDKFSWEHYAERVECVFQDVLTQEGPRALQRFRAGSHPTEAPKRS